MHVIFQSSTENIQVIQSGSYNLTLHTHHTARLSPNTTFSTKLWKHYSICWRSPRSVLTPVNYKSYEALQDWQPQAWQDLQLHHSWRIQDLNLLEKIKYISAPDLTRRKRYQYMGKTVWGSITWQAEKVKDTAQQCYYWQFLLHGWDSYILVSAFLLIDLIRSGITKYCCDLHVPRAILLILRLLRVT